MKVFNQYLVEMTIETVAQDIDKFNSASGGAIVLSADGFDGDFLQKSMFSSLHSARRRVDRYATQADITPTALAQIQDNVVKVAGGFGPVIWEPSQLSWIRKNEAAAIEAISKNLSEAILQDQLNTGITACVGAISNNTDLVLDVSGSDTVTYGNINASFRAFGDRQGALKCEIMDGVTYNALVGQNIANKDRLFVAGGVTVVDILGKLVIVTDAPVLSDAGKSKVLTLTEGGIVISNASSLITNIETSNGRTRIDTTFQADYDFGVGIKGYSWDIANGGKSPDDAALADGTNWDKFVTSNKDTAGVLLIADGAAGVSLRAAGVSPRAAGVSLRAAGVSLVAAGADDTDDADATA